ncbi:hypothetical protein ACF07Y_42970 [Streptomyces sp. NPDC016566]|uniref:hypothetical protein n=1 Tax=Streptomyces sp. NPDC016566 TaxID=3364967 RepID=UPI0037029BE8
MSNESERSILGELLFRESNAYVAALIEHGEDWTCVWPSVWPPQTPLAAVQGRFAVVREAAAAIGVAPSDSEITEQQEERMQYREMFPDGAPKLFG